jgi:hypothetical protein
MLDDGGGISGEQVEAGVAAAQAEKDAYYTQKVDSTGKTQAQLDAHQNATDTMNLINSTQNNSVTMDPSTGHLTYTPPKPKPTPTTTFIPTTPTTSTTPTPPTPQTPSQPPPTPPPPARTAPIDTILFNNDDMPIELMFDLIFEDIGGQELINIARNDTINGQNIIYQPIKNLTQIQRQYNPNNILSLQDTMDKYFENFSIIFEDKIPDVGNGINGEFVYIDPNNGDLVIEVINLEEDEQVQIDIVTSGTILYEENI